MECGGDGVHAGEHPDVEDVDGERGEEHVEVADVALADALARPGAVLQHDTKRSR